MALEDNVIFAHFFDALDSDDPVITPTDSGGGDPSVSAGTGTFSSASSGDGQIFDNTGRAFNPGLDGNFTVAVRGAITTDSYNSNMFIHLGDSGVWDLEFGFKQGGSDNVQAVYVNAAASHKCSTTTNGLTIGSTYTFVCRFKNDETNYFSIYVDGTDDTASRNGDFDAPNGGESMTLTSSTDITLGSEYDGSTPLDGTIAWVVVWDRAITDTELANNMNETDLKAAILGGGSIIAQVTNRRQARQAVKRTGNF